MVTPMKSILLAALFLAGTSLAAMAQMPYPAPTPAPYGVMSPAQALPPSWSYDPYTSGQAPCPQGIPGETGHCQDRMPPTYGQPSYWPSR
jgi:hypothetical protein